MLHFYKCQRGCMHGGVTRKASDRLPISIPWPVLEIGRVRWVPCSMIALRLGIH
jgi:hypothetical protein